MKDRVRRALPLAVWNRAAAATEILLDSLAAVLGAASRALPTDVRLELRRRLELRQRMDYPRADIRLRVTSRSERRLRLHSCAKEPETVAWLEESLQDGDVLYDIGANVGAYSLVAANLSGRRVQVYAFEPGARTFESLAENVAFNRLNDRVVTVPLALTDRTGLVPFEYASNEAGAARHPGVLTTGGTNTGMVLGYRLDEFIAHFGAPNPTHLKIDVDGSELLVLQGAERTLRSPQLRSVLVETTPGSAVGSAVRTLLTTAGFRHRGEFDRGGGREVNWVFDR